MSKFMYRHLCIHCADTLIIYICVIFLKYINLSLIPVTMRLSVLHLMMFSRLLYSAMYSSWLLGSDFRALLEFSSWVLHQHVIVDFLHTHVNLHYTMNYFTCYFFSLFPYYLTFCSSARLLQQPP